MPRPKLDDADKLVSFSVRMTSRQTARMQRMAATDGLPAQDHIRRALDAYMDTFETSFGLDPLPIGALPAYSLPAPTPQPAPTPLPAQPVSPVAAPLPNGVHTPPPQPTTLPLSIPPAPTTPFMTGLPEIDE